MNTQERRDEALAARRRATDAFKAAGLHYEHAHNCIIVEVTKGRHVRFYSRAEKWQIGNTFHRHHGDTLGLDGFLEWVGTLEGSNAS